MSIKVILGFGSARRKIIILSSLMLVILVAMIFIISNSFHPTESVLIASKTIPLDFKLSPNEPLKLIDFKEQKFVEGSMSLKIPCEYASKITIEATVEGKRQTMNLGGFSQKLPFSDKPAVCTYLPAVSYKTTQIYLMNDSQELLDFTTGDYSFGIIAYGY